jgi:hypothetical protein
MNYFIIIIKEMVEADIMGHSTPTTDADHSSKHGSGVLLL